MRKQELEYQIYAHDTHSHFAFSPIAHMMLLHN